MSLDILALGKQVRLEKNMTEDERGKKILALALIKHLYNEGKISETVYENIKKEYQQNRKNN